jgi:CubicO group peptidase (beta-lactamase class C family)
VLRLVADGKLSLDADVNTELSTWKVPATNFTNGNPVTLRRILSHTAGFTVHGFPGYPVDKPIPTLVQVLDGMSPAVTEPIRVDTPPGTLWRYSGGGYEVMQQMVLDATKEPFPQFMRETVLEPLDMTNSTYEQPPAEEMAARTAEGKFSDGHWVRGHWHVYPEMAAAGLWTTPSDLARFVIGVGQSYAGKSNPVLSKKMTREMLRVQYPALSNTDGLGLFITGSGGTFRFWHDGRNAGFDTFMTGLPNLRKGAVIMVNVNDDSGAVKEVMDAVAAEYQWKAAASH